MAKFGPFLADPLTRPSEAFLMANFALETVVGLLLECA
jgi:hypothetical protein